ncbi:hypothetical protein RJT34_26744 [Clitoria ternatea]|uniref:Protein PHYTOCHROME KINASE SUBSTRATE 4 n=1 Tax=Clitoria ternatea TaxID=43366 RepID=A0AAN9FBL7_CLITE
MERAIHSNQNPKSPTNRDRNASFSSPHLKPDQPNECEAMRPNGFRALDQDYSNSSLGLFHAHKHINEVTNNNDNIQKVSITSNNRVSPLLNMDTEHKHNPPQQGDITKSTRSFSYSASSSSFGGHHNTNINNNNNYKAHSFRAATPILSSSSSSSKASLNSKAGLLFHPQASSISLVKPPQNCPSDLSKKIRTSLSKPIWLLRRKCPCNDKKSVQIKENTPKPKPTTSRQPQTISHSQIIHKDSLKHNKDVNHQRQIQLQPQVIKSLSEGFSFPMFLATNSTTKPQVLLNVVHEEEDTPPRDSLQVFQPQSRAMDDDAASDASSDLFEIESFSTQAVPYTVTPSIAECHQPT